MEYLELEHVLPYLPYGLKWKYTGVDVDKKYGNILEMANISAINRVSLISESKNFVIRYFNVVNFEFVPILKPLSELENDDDFWNEFYIEFGGGYNNIKAFKKSWGIEILLDPLALGYKYWKILLKHHYDVFYLLDKDLAYNVALLPNGR